MHVLTVHFLSVSYKRFFSFEIQLPTTPRCKWNLETHYSITVLNMLSVLHRERLKNSSNLISTYAPVKVARWPAVPRMHARPLVE